MFSKPSFLSLPLVLVIIFSILFAYTTYGQSLSETWNVPTYQSSDYSEFYGTVYFANSMEEWDYRVNEVLDFSANQWLENANIMIEQMLFDENGEDSFVSQEGYVDERRRSLYSEVTVLYSEWERQLTEDYFENRIAFLQKLETGKVDVLYFQRMGQDSLYEEYTNEELGLAENRNRILESAREWEFEWGQTKQEGLDSFAKSFSDLQSDYDTYIRSLEETENQFSNNLNAINSYKETVKTALRDVVSQLKVGLDSTCSVASGCQYKNSDGTYNEAGKIFSNFIGELSEELNQSNIDPDSILTSISSKIKNFLSDESNKAFSEYKLYNGRIYTYQTGFQIDLGQSTSTFDLASAEWRLRNQTYHELSNDKRYENWLAGGFGEVGAFTNIYDSEMQGIFQSIHHGDYGRLISIMNNKLGDGRRVQSLVSANLYTDAFHFVNNQQIAGFYVPFEEAHHTHGNLLLDGHGKYGYWRADRYVTILTPGSHLFQMGAIGYSVLYEMFDENSSETSLYWKDNSTQLGGQYNHFQNTLLPAVSHWESKVKEYADTYEEWKDNRENLVIEATAKLESNRKELELSKEEWLKRLEDEKRSGLKSWTELYQAGETKEVNPPSISAWTPNQTSEVFDKTKVSEFQSLAKFESPADGIKIGGTGAGLLEEFHRTITGVSQYASVIQMNADLEEFKRSEQKKLINQMTYGINVDSLGGRKLTKEESILLGSYDPSQLSQEEQSRFGSCYEDPNASNCKHLLKKEYEATMDSNNGVLTLRKEIHNGLLTSKNTNGQYGAGKTEEIRHVQLGAISKVHVPSNKGFFTDWTEEDWNTLQEKKLNITKSFLSNSLEKDKNSINANLTAIQDKDHRNQELFLARKEAQENADSLIQELAIAYVTGGAAGMRASLKGKIESAINSELAKAWITATGGNESDIQMASMAFDFMRGKISAKKIQSRDQFISIKNPIQALESIVAKTFSTTMYVLDKVSLGTSTLAYNLFQAPGMAVMKTLVGERQYKKINERIAGTENLLQEIQANEQSLVQNGISIAISQGTGIPSEAISKMLGDKYGQIKAKKANKAMAQNPIYDIGSQVIGAFGGILKTAVVASGITENEIQSVMQDTNSFVNAGGPYQSSSTNTSLGYALQSIGLQASWTKHQSAYINLRDSKAVVEELGKRAFAKEIAMSMGIDENAIGQIIDSSYSSYQRQKSDKKARSNAVRQTAVNAASIAITLGASGALTGVSSTLSNIGKAVSSLTNGLLPATTQVGQVVASTFVQTIAGSHEGPKGAVAGFANGVLGGMAQGMGKIQSGFFKGMVPGIGVTYSEKDGWGGSLGLGNTINNMSVSFSEEGDTSIRTSKSLGDGLQLATDITTNGAANFGLNYNPTGKGPRTDWNFSMMYDINGGGFSGSIGYTDPNSKLGLNSSVDKNGISTSSELQGVTLGNNSEDGFEVQIMNFAEQNINAAQDKSDLGNTESLVASENGFDDFSDYAEAAGTMGVFLLGGLGLGLGVRNCLGGGLAGITSIGSDSKSISFGASTDKSIFGKITSPLKVGFQRFGAMITGIVDRFSFNKDSNNDYQASKETDQHISSEGIKKIQSSVIDDYPKDSRIDTEKKLYELRKAGVDTTEIEAKIKKLRGGKDIPMSKAVGIELKEYIRLREGNSQYPFIPDKTVLIPSSEALAGINLKHDPKKESNAAYVKRLGNEICEASKNVDLSTKELVTEHAVNVAKLLGESLKGKISYQQYKIIDGKEVVSAVNPVDASGFRAVDGLDCIRFIGAVLNASGITTHGSFANLNTDLYQMPEEMKNMGAEYDKRYVHKNGVEYFRQASNFMNLVSDRITTTKELEDHKANFKSKELSVGLIGITRADKNLPDSKISAVKSDHVYMITDKRFNQELGIFEYQIAESNGNLGVTNPWIRTETDSALRKKLDYNLSKQKLSQKEKDAMINKLLKSSKVYDYLQRSEFYELKPLGRVENKNEV